MPKIPTVSGAQAIKKFECVGYRVLRQKGSHVRLTPNTSAKRAMTVPLHKTLKKGLLGQLIKNAGLTVQQFIDL